MSTPPLAIVPPLSVLTPLAVAFTAPTFRHVQVLVAGTILASGRRTVAAALRAVGLGEERRFTTYHRVLNRGVWSALVLSRLLLDLLVRTFLAPEAPLELVVDGTLERRRGRKLAWKGRFHDAARSQSGHVVTSDGIHWVCAMLLSASPGAGVAGPCHSWRSRPSPRRSVPSWGGRTGPSRWSETAASRSCGSPTSAAPLACG